MKQVWFFSTLVRHAKEKQLPILWVKEILLGLTSYFVIEETEHRIVAYPIIDDPRVIETYFGPHSVTTQGIPISSLKNVSSWMVVPMPFTPGSPRFGLEPLTEMTPNGSG